MGSVLCFLLMPTFLIGFLLPYTPDTELALCRYNHFAMDRLMFLTKLNLQLANFAP
jgi:hypothetical protein